MTQVWFYLGNADTALFCGDLETVPQVGDIVKFEHRPIDPAKFTDEANAQDASLEGRVFSVVQVQHKLVFRDIGNVKQYVSVVVANASQA